MLTIRRFDVEVFEAPLKRPFVTALGRKTSTINVGFTLTLAGGARGYGEASSSLALAHLSPGRLKTSLERLGAWSIGRDAESWAELSRECWRKAADVSPAAAAFECALLEAVCASRGLSLFDWLGGARQSAETDLTLSASDEGQAAEAAAQAAREGFRILKIKVGTTPALDLARVRAARRAAPKARILLDGNQGLTVSSALRLVEACLKDGLRPVLLEQPVPKADLRGLKALTRRCPIPVAADESVATPQDAVRVAGEGAASIINIKVAKSGLLPSLKIAAAARAAGLKLMIGCMAETARGLRASVHLALGTGFFDFIDIDSDHLLVDDGRPRGWTRQGPRISI